MTSEFNSPRGLQYIEDIEWIGDLSFQDADVLAYYAKQYVGEHSCAVEHGSGGSTMILAKCCNMLYSFEDNHNWYLTTRQRMTNLGFEYQNDYLIDRSKINSIKKLNLKEQIDLIFIDGPSVNREIFANLSWNSLSDGGVMLFHDSREAPKGISSRARFEISSLPLRVANNHRSSIESIEFSVCASDGNKSNITVIKKQQQPKYVDWRMIEDRPEWSNGSNRNIKDLFITVEQNSAKIVKK